MTNRLEDINADVTLGNISSGDVLYIKTQEGINLSLHAISFVDKPASVIKVFGGDMALSRLKALYLSTVYSSQMSGDRGSGDYLNLETGEIWGNSQKTDLCCSKIKVNIPLHLKDYEILKRANP